MTSPLPFPLDAAEAYINQRFENQHARIIIGTRKKCLSSCVVFGYLVKGQMKVRSNCSHFHSHTYSQVDLVEELSQLEPGKKRPKAIVEARVKAHYNRQLLIPDVPTSAATQLIHVTGATSCGHAREEEPDDVELANRLSSIRGSIRDIMSDEEVDDFAAELEAAMLESYERQTGDIQTGEHANSLRWRIVKNNMPCDASIALASSFHTPLLGTRADHPVYIYIDPNGSFHMQLFNTIHLTQEMMRILAINMDAVFAAVEQHDVDGMCHAIAASVPQHLRTMFPQQAIHYAGRFFVDSLKFHTPASSPPFWTLHQPRLALQQLLTENEALATTGRVTGEVDDDEEMRDAEY